MNAAQLADKWQAEAAGTWGESKEHATLQRCADELRALGGGWISVEDQLPEFTNWNETSSGEVAILNDRDEVMSAEWAFNSYAATERGRLPRWERAGRIYQGIVTHWQPLPPSPAATVEG